MFVVYHLCYVNCLCSTLHVKLNTQVNSKQHIRPSLFFSVVSPSFLSRHSPCLPLSLLISRTYVLLHSPTWPSLPGRQAFSFSIYAIAATATAGCLLLPRPPAAAAGLQPPLPHAACCCRLRPLLPSNATCVTTPRYLRVHRNPLEIADHRFFKHIAAGSVQ